jgi:hypothetical protein
MLKIMGVLVILTLVFGAVFGSAAALNVMGGTIQAGEDLDLICDEDGIRVAGWGLETDDGLVYSIRFCDVDADCCDCELFVRVTGSDGSFIDGGWSKATIPSGGGCVRVTLRNPIPAADIYDLHVYIEGACNG